jgi:hypothetical protein
MLNEILETILEWIFILIIEIICFYTGEIILFIFTLGHHKLKWDYYSNEKPSKFSISTMSK